MRLEEYFPLEITRLAAGVRAHLEAGSPEAALKLMRAKLTLMEQVLGSTKCPPVDPPAIVGDARWDALLSAALLDVLGDAWPEPAVLVERWYPMGEEGSARIETESQTPAVLARANVYSRLQDIRWPTTGTTQSTK